MESPLWELKPEPVSPPHIYEDTWCFDDVSADLTAFKLQSAVVKHEDDGESKAEVYSKLLEDLDELDQLEDFIKEEPFSNWLEEKVDLPIFDDIRIEPPRGYAPAPLQRFKHEDLKTISQPHNHVVQPLLQPLVQSLNPLQPGVQDTNMLLQEFETVFGAVEMNHGQLTPPQSPPLTPPHVQNVQPIVLTPLTPISFVNQSRVPLSIPVSLQQSLQLPVYYQQQAPATPQPDVAHELAVVEELVRSRAENLVTDSWDQPAPSSPSSSSSSGFSEYSSDPEWIPDTVQSTSAAGASNEEESTLVERSARGRKRAGKPYARVGPEDKKSRKKEQNKNAATRYRLKKKAEIEEILGEERQLADVKGELQTQVSDLQREIKCLKGLMRDLFKAKGLIQ